MSAYRKALATLLIAAGLGWSILFPKKASLDRDMVISICLGIGLLGSGTIVALVPRLGRMTSMLVLLLLASVLGNICLLAENHSYAEILRRTLSSESLTPRAADDSGQPATPQTR